MLNRIVFIIFISHFAQAAELVEPNTSIRALGMGNAFSSVAEYDDALFYNPARLTAVKGINWKIVGLHLGANGMEAYNAYKDFSGQPSSATFADKLHTLFGKKIWLGLGAKTAVTLPYLGIAAYDSLFASAYLENPAFPNLNVNFFNDYGIVAGFAFDPVPDILSIGITGRKITRIGSAFPIGVSTLATLSSTELQNQLNNRGNGYGADIGMTLEIPSPIKPTFSFVWKNVGYTTFTKDYGSIAPPQIKDEMISGFSFLIDLPGLNIRPSFDMKYMNRPQEQLGKKLHFGIEFDFPVFDFRAGFNQGYYTLGVGTDLGVFKLDAATYGVELGEYPGQHEDRRYMVQMSLELGFDPSLGFLKRGSGSSGLKQRR